MFLYKPQPLGTNVNGGFVPLNITIPQAPADVGCLALRLLASAAPDQAEPLAQAVSEVQNQLIVPLFASAGCSIADYEIAANNSYVIPGEDANAGSGSGITHFGEWDSQTVVPTGLSSSNPVRRALKALRFVS